MRATNAILAAAVVLSVLVLAGNRSCIPEPVDVVCEYDGATYAPGASFPATDGCNTCTCLDDGRVACTEMACVPCDPDAEWWREYVAHSPEECAVIRYACEGNTTGFQNACGCGCEQSEDCPEWFNCMPGPGAPACDLTWIRENCPFSGIAY